MTSEPSRFEKFRAFVGKNAFQADAQKAEEEIRSQEPLLLHAQEKIELAFTDRGGKGRDRSYLTSHRILIKDGKGIGHKRKNFRSIPYDSIQGFKLETAGSFDGDVELHVYSPIYGYDQLDFAKGQVDIFEVHMFLNTKIFTTLEESQRAAAASVSANGDADVAPYDLKKAGTLDSLFNFLGDNAVELAAEPYEHRLKTETPVLLPDEKVELAYKVGRDSTVFTSKRILFIDVQGIRGKRIVFFSLPWKAVSGFSVETAGALIDRDTEFHIFTNIQSLPRIEQDLRNGKADLWALNRCISNHVLGEDKEEMEGVDKMEGHVDQGGVFKLFGSDNRPLDAVEMNKKFHTSPRILQAGEVCEYAFKGRRDMILFTTKRIVLVDPKGLRGVKVEYKSLPWKSVIGFGVRSAGTIDVDSEVLIWTDIMHDPPPPKSDPEGPPEPPLPGNSFWELDFNKNLVDIKAVHRYLSTRCLETQPGVPISNLDIAPSRVDTGIEKFISKIGNDQRTIDPRELDTYLHTECPMLLDSENVVMAFKAGRDMTVFTNRRIMFVDTQGITGKKVEYSSVAYSNIRAFSTESAGSWDRDSEMDIYTRNFWTLGKKEQDFRKGKADIVTIQKFLAAMVLGDLAEAQKFSDSQAGGQVSNPAGIGNFLGWITSNSVEQDAEATNSQLHSDPPILLDEEQVLKAYKCGRDLYVYTNMRVLDVDVQGLLGKRVEYKSYPLKYVSTFSVETAGHLDRDAEVFIHSDIPDCHMVQQDILVKRGDVMEVHQLLTDLLMFRNRGRREEEIVL